MCGLSAWVGCVNATVAFAMEGEVARRPGKRSDALGEQTQFVDRKWHQKNKTGPMIITYLRRENCKGIRRKKRPKAGNCRLFTLTVFTFVCTSTKNKTNTKISSVQLAGPKRLWMLPGSNLIVASKAPERTCKLNKSILKQKGKETHKKLSLAAQHCKVSKGEITTRNLISSLYA